MNRLKDWLRRLFRRTRTVAPSASPSSVALDPWADVVEMLPLSSQVFLVRRRSGTWCLTDWRRFSPAHDDIEGALAHRTAFRRLDHHEPERLADFLPGD